MQAWAKSKGFEWFTAEDNEIKASIVERLNRTIQGRMFKVFRMRGNHKWVDVLPKIMDGYARSWHSSIKLEPINANTDNPDTVARVYNALYGPRSRLNRGLKAEVLKPAGRTVPLNTNVRVGRTKNIFEKGYTPNFTDEVFKVNKVIGTVPQVYNTVGEGGPSDSIKGTWYPSEIQRVGTLAKRRRYFRHARN